MATQLSAVSSFTIANTMQTRRRTDPAYWRILIFIGELFEAQKSLIYGLLYAERYGRGRSAGWRASCLPFAQGMTAKRIASGRWLNQAAARRRGA